MLEKNSSDVQTLGVPSPAQGSPGNLPQTGRWLWKALVLAGLVLATLAQWFLVALPSWPTLPQAWTEALRPVWPHPGAVVAAIVAFAAAIPFFVLGTRRAAGAPAQPFADVRLPGWVQGRRFALVLGGVAVLGWLVVVLLLATTTYRPSYPRWFCLAVGLLLGALWLKEARLSWRPSEQRCPSTRVVLEWLYVTALVAAFIYLNVFDLDSWYYFSIGDEHAFYLASLQMAEGQTIRNLFSQQGAYEIIPVLSSYVEGLQMRVFGMDGFGWKLSVALQAALSLVPSYLLARSLYGVRVAAVALLMLAASHYLLAYSHTGYPNVETLLPTMAAFLCFALGTRRSSTLLLVVCGICAALGWFTYYPSRATIVILGVAVVVYVRPRAWVPVGFTILGGFALLFLPFLVVNQEEIFRRMFEQTGTGTVTEAAANRDLLPLWNTGRSLLAFNYNTHDGPYLHGSLVEPVTAALFLLGLGLVAGTLRDARSRFLGVWFGIGIVVTGIVSKYDYVSVSRLNFLLPLVTLLAALALDRSLGSLAPRAPSSGRWAFLATALVLVGGAVVFGNLYRWFVVAPGNVPSTPENITIRAVEHPACQAALLPPLIVDVGIGGAIAPALVARDAILQPHFALYHEPKEWIESAPMRCVVFRTPHDSRAMALMHEMEERWPEARGVDEFDLARVRRVRVYYPQPRETARASDR